MILEYPKFVKMAFTLLEHQLDFLNRRFLETAINRSAQVREAIELLIVKYGGELVYEPPKGITSQDDETLKQMVEHTGEASASPCDSRGRVEKYVLR